MGAANMSSHPTRCSVALECNGCVLRRAFLAMMRCLGSSSFSNFHQFVFFSPVRQLWLTRPLAHALCYWTILTLSSTCAMCNPCCLRITLPHDPTSMAYAKRTCPNICIIQTYGRVMVGQLCQPHDLIHASYIIIDNL